MIPEKGSPPAARILVNRESMQEVNHGMNIVVYNDFTDTMADAVGFGGTEGWRLARE